MTTDLKARLLASREAATDTVEIDGVGTVTVRAISRGEVFALHKITNDALEFEQKFVALGMVDPEMSESDVKLWQSVPGAVGEIQSVSDKIEALSGLKAGADKSSVQSA